MKTDKLVIVLTLAFSVETAHAEQPEPPTLEKICQLPSNREHVNSANSVEKYTLDYVALSDTTRRYFVQYEGSECAYAFDHLVGGNWSFPQLFARYLMPVPTEYAKPKRLDIPRFLSDPELETEILKREFSMCRETESRATCREKVKRKTRAEAASLLIRSASSDVTIVFYQGEAFVEGKKID